MAMMLVLTAVLAMACQGAAKAECFVEPCFRKDAVVVHRNITYGEAYDPVLKRVEVLTLDVYLPPDSDTRPLRPAAVLVHGGSFVEGNSQSDSEPQLAYELVTRGYVAVSINCEALIASYSPTRPLRCPAHWPCRHHPPTDRLDGSIGLTSDIPGEDAGEDAKAAIRFVRSMNLTWRVDPAKVMIAGDSAGAVTALWVGYAMTDRPGHSGNPGFSDAVGAVVSVSGEMKSQAFCKTVTPTPLNCTLSDPSKDYVGNITGPPQPPLLMLHGTADLTVPYVNGLEVYTRAKDVGLPALMLTVPDAGHVPFDSLFYNATRLGQFMTFLADNFATNSTCAC
eukprot:m.148749 g.148749  ORF g.148749 m.148749 type:complete len:337 (-) comp23218_c0_seq2:58-1068(-)